MATKKPTAKQIAARKNFSKMAKNGTLKKLREKANIKKTGLKGTTPTGLKKVVAKSIGVCGLRKLDGTLKKGFKYEKGGKIVKVKK